MSGTDTYMDWDDSKRMTTMTAEIHDYLNKPTIEDLFAELGDKFYSLTRGTDGWCADSYTAEADRVVATPGYYPTAADALTALLNLVSQPKV